MKNFIDRTLFKTTNISQQELLRRLDILAMQLNSTVEAIKTNIESIETVTSSDTYTGTVYAVDENNNTVSLFVQNGKVKTVGVVK